MGQTVSATLPASATAWATAATVGTVNQSTSHPPPTRATAIVAAMNVVPEMATAAAPPYAAMIPAAWLSTMSPAEAARKNTSESVQNTDRRRSCSSGVATAAPDESVTPDALRAIGRKELPGFGEIMRAESFKRFPNAILSRSLAVIVSQSLVIALPGNPKARSIRRSSHALSAGQAIVNLPCGIHKLAYYIRSLSRQGGGSRCAVPWI